MNVGIYYFTTSGNTEEMAKALAEGFEQKGAHVVLNDCDSADSSEIESADILGLGSPAQGTEEVDSTSFEPFVQANMAALKGKKVILFGSFGWGGGEYMEQFAETLKGEGVDVVKVLTHLESPDDACLDELRSLAQTV